MGILNIYGVGGCGINLCSDLKQNAKNPVITKANYILIDTSDRNSKLISQDNKTKVILMEDADGGGKERATNFDKAFVFIDNVLRSQPGGDFNIVIYSASGASGGLLGPILARDLIKAGKPTLNIIVGENSDLKGSENNYKTLATLDSFIKQINEPFIFKYFENNGSTRGRVNSEIIDTLDGVGILFDPNLKEIDGNDIKHFFFYNKVTDAKPILSELNLTASDEVHDNIVSVASLYTDERNIGSSFDGVGYKTTGVITSGVKIPSELTEIHYTIDYGKGLKTVKDKIRSIKTKLSEKSYKNLDFDTPFDDQEEAENGVIV